MISKNNLETSIIQNAAFEAGFLEILLDFLTSMNAPLLARLLGSITYKLIRKHLNRGVDSHPVYWQ
jgi:hypothetical protein